MGGITTTVLTIGSTALTAISAIRQGNAAKNQADFQAKVAQQQAERERQVAAQKATTKRNETSRALARNRAIRAASGIDIGTGSSLLVQEDFATEAELQALRIEQGGEVTATRLENEASLLKTSGKNARTAGFIRGGASLLSGATKVSEQFSKNKNKKSD